MFPKIVYEDESICVIDKPTGIVVNNSATTKDGDTVQDWFKDKRSRGEGEFEQKGGVVHRLDKDTSGLLVLAKTAAAYDYLKQQFLNRKAEKSYMALVHGDVKPEKRIISLPVGRHPGNPKQFAVIEDKARTAVTQWQVIGRYRDKQTGEIYSLLMLTPLTGRTHQLRVHLKYFHYPIAGDPIYGDRKSWKKDLKWCPRLFLHAEKLGLTHPLSFEKMTWETVFPDDLKSALNNLEKIE
jgi:23S rRNA pseudouridine1911/1915/1917 synthase